MELAVASSYAYPSPVAFASDRLPEADISLWSRYADPRRADTRNKSALRSNLDGFAATFQELARLRLQEQVGVTSDQTVGP